MSATAPHSTSKILERSLHVSNNHIPVEGAQWILENVKLADEDRARVEELYELHMEEKITPEQSRELDDYSRVIALIDIMRAKAKSCVRRAAA